VALQGLARLLLRHPLGSQLAQLVIDERKELLRCAGVALLDGGQDLSDVAHAGKFTAPAATRLSWRRRENCALRSDRPKPAFRKVILDRDRRSDGRYLEISATSCPEGATPDWRWPPTHDSGPFALATPCAHVPGRYSGPTNDKSRVAHPWSWDLGSSTIAAQTRLNMVVSCEKARPFGLCTKLGLQENGRPSPKGTALWPGTC
jgi:hypothetical protein